MLIRWDISIIYYTNILIGISWEYMTHGDLGLADNRGSSQVVPTVHGRIIPIQVVEQYQQYLSAKYELVGIFIPNIWKIKNPNHQFFLPVFLSLMPARWLERGNSVTVNPKAPLVRSDLQSATLRRWRQTVQSASFASARVTKMGSKPLIHDSQSMGVPWERS